MTLKDMLKEEFLGMSLEVVSSPAKGVVTLSGIIIDETKESFVILTNDGQKKTLLKRQITFTLSRPDMTDVLPGISKIEIDGKKICYRSHDRIKKTR